MQHGTDGGYGTGVFILTRRLAIRPASAEDRLQIGLLAANPRVAETLAAAPAEASGPDSARFAVVEKEGAALVGEASWGALQGKPGSVEIAAWIGEAHWGRGYATEAVQALIDHVFGDGRTQFVWCATRASSTRSRRVVEKCGFQYRGTGMVRGPSRSGAVPVERFVLERRNWESLKAWGAMIKPMEAGHAPHDTAA